MKLDEVDEILLKTLDDQRLSRGEKKVLTALFAEHKERPQDLAYIRHRAFEVARNQLYDSRQKQVVTWLEEVVKAVAHAAGPEPVPPLAEAHFSPGDDCRRRIVSLIGLARRTAEICVFTITDDRIAHALLEAHGRGVAIRIITDDDKMDDRGSDIEDLARAGISVRTDHTSHHMHHKFAIFDGMFLVTGSYNWTFSAASFNEENIVVSNDGRLIQAFGATFERLWKLFGPGAG
jgi:phosphatidylserine/phosphatidylglycerophosphate/cardiolipin synthase-like enzyme